MHPFHFGSGERKLFGIYHPAPDGTSRSQVVVMANPWGWEALRAHRTMRMLALKLQKEGFGVFRFDYFGSGDSFGEDADASLHGWTQDLEWAVEEALALSGKHQAILIGLRLGAFLAGRVGLGLPGQVSRVVFWEPTASGREMLREWTGASEPPTQGTWVNGFFLPEAFGQDLWNLNLRDFDSLGEKAILAETLRSEQDSGLDVPAGWRAMRVQGPECWKEERDLGAGAVPVELLNELAEGLP